MTATAAPDGRKGEQADSLSRRPVQGDTRFGDLLLSHSLLNLHDLNAAIERSEQQQVPLADAIVQLGLVSETDSYAALACATGLPLVDLSEVTPSTLAIRLVPERVARRHILVPLNEDNRMLTYAVSRAFDDEAERDVAFASGRKPRAVLARRSELSNALDRCYPKMADVDLLLTRVRSKAVIEMVDCGDTSVPTESPIIDLCNQIIARAVEAAASDVHIEPTAHAEARRGIAHPLLGSSGAVERVIFAAIELDRLEHFVSTLKPPRGVTLTLLDRDHTILARYPDSAQWVGKVSTDLPIARQLALVHSEEVGDVVGVDGVPRLYATVQVHASLSTGLYIGMSIERAVAFAEADRLLRQQLWLLAFMSLVAITTAWIGGNAFVLRPINRLKNLTQRLAAGDFSGRAQLTSGAPGLHDLGDAINSMATALEARERERQQSEERYREMFMNNLTGAWIATSAGRLIACNPAFASMFGFASVEDALRTDLASIYESPGDRKAFLDLLRAERRIENRETEFRRADGKPLHVIQTAVGIFDEGGDLIEIRGYLIDTTQRKQLEDELRDAQKMEAVGRLAGGIAHEFNNILTAIIGFSELLLHSLEPKAPGRADVEEIQKAAKRATDLTRQFLALSRRQVVQPVVLDVNVVLRGMDSLVRRLLGEDLDFVTMLATSEARVKMDRGQLDQVVTNLVINARDAMPGGGKLTVEISIVQLDEFGRGRFELRPGRYVLMSVSDTGTGIDAETLPHIFEPFFTTKEIGRGTGLGLSTVYGIVKQADGFIDVHSEPGSTTFRIYLPVTDEPVTFAEGAPPKIGPVLRDLTVLVVEDDIAVRELIRKTLLGERCRILEAGNGSEAISLLEQRGTPVDLVLTDVVMPGMGGRALAGHVRQLYPELKILFMSGYPSTMIAHHEVLNPGVFFLEKPFTPDVLKTKVFEMLR